MSDLLKNYLSLTAQEQMIGKLLEEKDYLINNLELLKLSSLLNQKTKQIINAITNPETPFQDILKNTTREHLIYAMTLANSYAQYKIKKGYKNEISKINN